MHFANYIRSHAWKPELTGSVFLIYSRDLLVPFIDWELGQLPGSCAPKSSSAGLPSVPDHGPSEREHQTPSLSVGAKKRCIPRPRELLVPAHTLPPDPLQEKTASES